MADLDIYVDYVRQFRRLHGFTVHMLLAGLEKSDLSYRVLDKFDTRTVGECAFLHVDLTELPQEFATVHKNYRRSINGTATSINRKLYSMARLEQDDEFDGPVITKTVLNHKGVPEFVYERDQSLFKRLKWKYNQRRDPFYINTVCPPYEIYESIGQVPPDTWSDPHLIVEKFLPGKLDLPIVKHRCEFFLDCELNTRSVFDSLFCDPLSVRSVEDAGKTPDAVTEVRRKLHLDFGSIDYFVVDGEAVVIDANKVTTATPEWIAEYPFIVRYFGEVTDRLVAFVRDK